MTANKHLAHLYVLPEDDANSRIATGFHLEVDSIRQMDVLPVAGGWAEVVNRFKSDHVSELDRYPTRYMILMVDFDKKSDRLKKVKAAIPEHLVERVFVLGSWSEPEDLKKNKLGTLESIGQTLAKECRDKTNTLWDHALIKHNVPEVARIPDNILDVLFKH